LLKLEKRRSNLHRMDSLKRYFLSEAISQGKEEQNAHFRAFFVESLLDFGNEFGVSFSEIRKAALNAGEFPKFRFAEKGKPYFADEDLAKVFFSISNTKGIRGVAFALSEVGFDIENIAEDARALADEDALALARRYFAKDEIDFVEHIEQSVDWQTIRERFFYIWTRKEAYLKWLGAGLGGGLQRFSVLVSIQDVRIESGRKENFLWAEAH